MMYRSQGNEIKRDLEISCYTHVRVSTYTRANTRTHNTEKHVWPLHLRVPKISVYTCIYIILT